MRLLSSELATLLSGRYIEIKMYPLSFKEFLKFNEYDTNNIEEKFDDLQTILNSSKEFNFKDDSILKLKQYYGNKEIYLDLSKIDINMFEDLYYDSEKELDDMEDYDL